MTSSGDSAAEACPVDHQTRAKWLNAAKANGDKVPSGPDTAAAAQPPQQQSRSIHYSLDTGRWQPLTISRRARKKSGSDTLDHHRQVSSIPRATSTASNAALNSAERAALPDNSEQDTGHDRESGNWIYPSQEMFFKAMQRKGHEANPADMSSIVPIHNAVNERAWAEIKAWEAGRGSEACGGPKLVSFAGDSKAKTPRARYNTLVGYSEPFDRHDWVIDRCGKKIEYVIDFYSGKGSGEGLKGLNFYLDVRPKLNSWEGIKMRVMKTFSG